MAETPPKGPMASRKFRAYLLAEGSWKTLAGLVLIFFRNEMSLLVFGILLAIIIVAGFIEAGYILGQASLDKYLRVAQLVTESGHDMTMGTLQIKANGKPKQGRPKESPEQPKDTPAPPDSGETP